MHLESSNESEVRRQALAKMRMSRSLKTNDKVRVMLLEGQLFQERYAGQYLNSQKYELIAGDRGTRQHNADGVRTPAHGSTWQLAHM